jgi:hypothetical protein
MSLKAFHVTRSIRRRQHLTGWVRPPMVRKHKKLSRRGERQQVRRELRVLTDEE